MTTGPEHDRLYYFNHNSIYFSRIYICIVHVYHISCTFHDVFCTTYRAHAFLKGVFCSSAALIALCCFSLINAHVNAKPRTYFSFSSMVSLFTYILSAYCAYILSASCVVPSGEGPSSLLLHASLQKQETYVLLAGVVVNGFA